MSYGFGGLLPLLIQLPIWIGLWVGVIGIGKRGKSTEWWCMLIGICSITFGGLTSSTLLVMMALGVESIQKFYGSSLAPYLISSGTSSLGYLLFVAGFAIHGQKSSKDRARILELESIANAQGEELARAQQGYDSGR